MAKEHLTYVINLQNKKLKQKLKESSREVNKFSTKAKSSFKKIANAIKSPIVGIIGFTAAIYKLTSVIGQGIRRAVEMNKSFAEVNTLFDGAGGLTENTKKLIKAQSELYGSDMISNINGFYDIVSSGITDQKKALEVLNESNRLAVVGLTDIKTAADLVTSVMNAYGHETMSVAEITDTLMQTVKKGKTIMPELGASLGQVLPLASNMGIEFKELSGFMALLTAKGNNTAKVVTQVRGLLNTLAKKEGKDAKKIVKELGFEFNIATAKTMGLSKMLLELARVTKGSEDKLVQMFPNLRAMTGSMGALSNEGKDLVEMMKNFKDVTGTVDEALKKVMDEKFKRLEIAVNRNKNSWAAFAESLVESRIKLAEFANAIPSVLTGLGKIGKAIKENVGHFMSQGLFGAIGKGIGKFVNSPESMLGRLGTHIGDEWYKMLNPKGGQDDFSSRVDKIEQGQSLKKRKEIEKVVTEATKKRTELYTKTEEKIKDLYLTTIEKIKDGVKRIREEAEKAIKKLRMSFGGRGFANLAKGSQAIGGDYQAKATFQDFARQIDIKNLDDQAIRKLAEASVGFNELGSEGKAAFQTILRQVKDFKKELTADDFSGFVEAAKTGFTNLTQEFADLWKKSIEARMGDVEVKAKEKEEKLFIEGLRSFRSAQEKVIQAAAKEQEEFKKSVDVMKLSAEAFKIATEEFNKAQQTPIKLELKGDLQNLIDKSFEKTKQNQTGNLPGRGG